MLNAGRDINIGTYNDNKGSDIAVALPGGVVQQTVTPVDQPQPDPPSVKASSNPRKAPASNGKSTIRLSDVKKKKIGFFRVIKALHKEGFFESVTGGAPTEKETFAAFGIALNEDFSDFTGHLSANRKDNTPETRAEVFDTLKRSYLSYEQNIDDNKADRESSID